MGERGGWRGKGRRGRAEGNEEEKGEGERRRRGDEERGGVL